MDVEQKSSTGFSNGAPYEPNSRAALTAGELFSTSNALSFAPTEWSSASSGPTTRPTGEASPASASSTLSSVELRKVGAVNYLQWLPLELRQELWWCMATSSPYLYGSTHQFSAFWRRLQIHEVVMDLML